MAIGLERLLPTPTIFCATPIIQSAIFQLIRSIAVMSSIGVWLVFSDQSAQFRIRSFISFSGTPWIRPIDHQSPVTIIAQPPQGKQNVTHSRVIIVSLSSQYKTLVWPCYHLNLFTLCIDAMLCAMAIAAVGLQPCQHACLSAHIFTLLSVMIQLFKCIVYVLFWCIICKYWPIEFR